MRRFFAAFAFTALSSVIATDASAAFVTYNSRAAWEAAVISFQTEEFDIPNTGVLAADTTHPLGLIQFSYTGAPLGNFFPNVFDGELVSVVTRTSSGGGTTDPGPNTFTLPNTVNAVGFDVDDAEAGIFLAAGMEVAIPSNDDLQFFGVVSDTSFTSFVIDIDQTGFAGNDVFDLLNVSFGPTIPEPSSLALLGLGGLLVMRRRRVA